MSDSSGGTAARVESVFERVVVGVDGSEAGFEACRQTARLAPPTAAIDAVAVVHIADAIQEAMESARIADLLRREAESALATAGRILGERAALRLVNGYATAALLREIADVGATLVALGSHGHRRATEILIGGVAGELLHEASCSVLVARTPPEASRFPRSVVVGIDGSGGADAALAAAQQLAARTEAPLRVVTALRGKSVDVGHVHLRAPFAEEIDEHPVDALVHASRDADLVVVGSRGLHGPRALGSVSERVAHRAGSSVLVVRSSSAP